MAFRSKRNAVVADSVATSTFQLSSLSSAASTAPLFVYSPTSTSRSASIPPGSTLKISKNITIPRKNDNECVNDWIDAMKASSPPGSRSGNGELFGFETIDLQYCSWIDKHPSALAMFDHIFESASEKRVAVFLDYDGTLSPIVEDPDRAFISEAMRSTVKEVATYFPTAIISGRSWEKVYEFVQLTELYYAGSHGMDIMGPEKACSWAKPDGAPSLDINVVKQGNNVILFRPADDFTPLIDEICKVLNEKVKDVSGAMIENNKFSASVHFRRVKEENWETLAEHVHSVLQTYPNLQLSQGRKVLEIRPLIAWDKGKALEFLIKTLGIGSRDDVFPVYIGDDRTDEDAFRVLKEGYGLSIIVSSGAAKETNAAYSLYDPSEVMEFLKCLVRWRQKCLSSPLISKGNSSMQKHIS